MVPTQSQPSDRSFAIVPMPYSPLQDIKFNTRYLEYEEDEGDSRVEGELPGMRVLGRPVRDDHLRERHAVEDGAQRPLVVVCHCRDHDALAVVERCNPIPNSSIHTLTK